ncbi:MAG: hydrogenase maturation protease [Actinobacteria bacterium]|nr:hydrogenase maturation protease [Actinomycetota bacterium]
MSGRTLVAGVGNIFLGDDGFGPEVARRLAGSALPDGVRVADYGTSGMHLAYDLAGYQTAILVDAAPRGEAPGTVTVLDVEPGHRPAPAADGLAGSRLFDGHGMQPDLVFGVLDMLGGTASRILVVCCEPASTDYRIGLSEPVAGAVGEAVRIVRDLLGTAAGEPPAAVAGAGEE